MCLGPYDFDYFVDYLPIAHFNFPQFVGKFRIACLSRQYYLKNNIFTCIFGVGIQRISNSQNSFLFLCLSFSFLFLFLFLFLLLSNE